MKLATDERLRAVVVELLRKRYSPDQIAGRLRLDFPHDEGMRVTHEAIYTWIYALPVGELARLGVHLRSRRVRRRPRQTRPAKAAPKICDIRWIDERPDEVQGRQVPGHWESQ